MMRNLPWAAVLALLSGIAGLTGIAALGESAQPLPTPFPQARYQQMSASSPFVVSTAAATAAPTPGFASQLYIDGVAHVGKTDFVAIKSRDPDNQKVIFLEVGKTTEDGLKVERIKWSDEMGKSTVDVSKAGEKATLVFDQMTTASNPAPVVPSQPGTLRLPPVPGRPNFPPQNGQPPYGQRFFQQPGQLQGPGTTLTPAMLLQQRRRVRGEIQSGQ
jgi:hypothetical protein